MKPYSLDLRQKIVNAYETGKMSIRQVASIFQVSKTTVQELLKRKRETGELAPRQPTGGKSSQLLGMETQIEEMVKAHRDYTLAEYCEEWEDKTGVRVSESTMCRYLKQQQLTLKKKTLRSTQSTTEKNQIKRVDYWEEIRGIAPENLIFLDEMGILLGMMRLMARSKKGERIYDFKPFYRGSRVTVIGAISQTEIMAIKTLGESMKGKDFSQFIEELVPKLWEGAVVVMDNLKAHKVAGVKEMIEAVGAKVIYLSPYSPEFNPIEHLWWQLKAFIRRFVPKNKEAVTKLIELGVKLCSSEQITHYFTHCCYCT
jgi:transposase